MAELGEEVQVELASMKMGGVSAEEVGVVSVAQEEDRGRGMERSVARDPCS